MQRITGIGGIFITARDADPRIEASELGRFGWVMDPEGNKVELREPPRA